MKINLRSLSRHERLWMNFYTTPLRKSQKSGVKSLEKKDRNYPEEKCNKPFVDYRNSGTGFHVCINWNGTRYELHWFHHFHWHL